MTAVAFMPELKDVSAFVRLTAQIYDVSRFTVTQSKRNYYVVWDVGVRGL